MTTKTENYYIAYTLMCGADAADAVIAAAKQRYEENGTDSLLAGWLPEYTEDDCICDALRTAILDAYFGPMIQTAAITLRDALGEYGTLCIDSRCSDLTFHGWEIAEQYNTRHTGSEIGTHCTGYVALEI